MLPHILKQIQLQGQVTASMILLPMPQEAVQNILPKGLSPAAQPFTPAGTHPVFFVFTQEVRVHFVLFNKFSSLHFKDYWEFVLEIPYVKKDKEAHPRLYCYPARLYLNRLAPTLVGLLGYGFPKRLTKIEASATSYNIKTLRDVQLLSGQFELTGGRGPISEFPNFQQGSLQMLSQPVLTQYPPLKKFPGIFLCSLFGYHFNPQPPNSSFEQAQLQAMNAKVQLFQHFASEFLPGLLGDYTVTNINQSPLGAFRLWADWVLTPC